MALDATNLTDGTSVLVDTKTDADTGGQVITTYDANTGEVIGNEIKDAGGNTTFKIVKTADETGYSAAADVAANADLLLTGALSAAGKITNTVAEKVSITSAGDDSGMFYDVTGTNAAGVVETERVSGANDGTVQTTAKFLEVTLVKAVGTPADKVSLAGEGYKEVVTQNGTGKETNEAGVTADVAFSVEKTINYDGGAKIKSGTEKIDGREKTLGENGIVTAETMDTSLLGDALAGDTLAAVAARYDAVAANATIYAEAENLGGGTTVTTLYAADDTIVGSSDTTVETFGNMTLTVTNHFAAPTTGSAGDIIAGEYIGTSGTDGTNTWDFTKTEVTTDLNADGDSTFTNTPAYKETGSESYGGETRTFTYFFSKATGELLSGSEVVDGITTTFGANWAITKETIDTGDLGTALSSTVLDGLPAAVKAASGDTFSKTETFAWGGGETTYFNAVGDTLGFGYTWADAATGNSNNSFYDANDNYVGDSWTDGDRSGSSSLTYVNGKVTVETGSYADANNSGDDNSWTYNFNSAGVMTGGEEVRGATTTTLGENWTVNSTAVAVTGLATLDLDSLDTNIKNAFFKDMTTVYTTTETFEWGGTLMTFIHADGSIIGYADSYSDDWDGDGNADSTGITYMNADWSYVGSSWSDSWGTGERFETNKDKNGDALASGLTREFGNDSWGDGQGGQETRTYDYTFDTTGQYWELDSGTETGSDGVTTVYGANWAIVSQKGDASKLGDALTTAELVGVPTSIQSALTDEETYAKTSVYDWGTDTTYYDSTGAILGYSNASSWDMDDGGSNTNKSYQDANWNWLGGSWADIDASGATIRSGSNSSVDIMTNAVKTGFTDTGSYREGDEGSSYSWTFSVTTDANGYENHAMTGGTEVRGTYNASDVLVGTTYTYGPDWVLQGAQADTSNLATLDLSTLDASLVTALFGSATAVIKFSTETFDWNQGFSQQTYYNANGDIVGYGDSWSDDWDGDGVIDSSGQSYMDANWDYVGGSYSDDWDGDGVADSSGYNFTIKTEAGGVVTQIQELGENTWMDYDGNPQTNKYDFTYDGNWNLISGTEERGQKDAAGDLSGGETVTYGANWEVLSVSRDVNLSSEKIAELTAVDLAGIPTALHAATGKTYVETEVNSWGTQKTYLDSAGQILGYSDAWSDDWDGDGTADSVGTSYQDADWNHLGSTYDDQWSTGFHHTVEGKDANDNKIYIETGSRTEKMANGDLGEVTETNFIFDENWNMVSGTETRGDTVDANGDLVGTTITFGPNWTILSQTTDPGSLTAANVSGLPASVKTLLFALEADLTAVMSDTETFPWGGSQTTYFDAAGNVIGYMDTYADDWDGNGTIDSSGTSFMDANWNYIGGTYSDEWGSGSNFTVLNPNAQTIDSVDYLGTRVDSGTSSWTNHNNVVETRTFEYTYDLNYNFITGTETSSDGTTTNYGLNWVVTGSSFAVGNLVALTGAELLLLPTPLKAAVGETFSKVEDWGGGSKQTTYIDAAGNILGYHDTWTFTDGNETYSGSSYMDANWNHFGGSNTMKVDGVVTSSSESSRIKNLDGTEIETGSNTWKDGSTTMTSSFTFNFDAAGEMTGGSEVRPDGTTVTLGANWAFVGEAISINGLQAISQADFDLLPGSITGATAAATLFKDTTDIGMQHGMGGGTNVQKTLLSEAGVVLGYWDTFSEDWDGDSVVDYVSTNFMDANWNWLGGSGADWNTDSGDGMKWSEVTASTLAGGYTETRTQTEKNYDGNDVAGANGTFTGMSRVTVTEYDANDNFLGSTEISTLPNGNKMQFVFNEFYEAVGEYTYVLKNGGTAGDDLAEYDKVISDKYSLFQLEKFIITDDYMKGFAESQGYTNFSDGDGDGIADAFTEDFDGDGVADLTSSFGQSVIDATVFSGAMPVVDFNTPNDITSGLKGLTFTANGLKMVWVGDWTLIPNPQWADGIDNVASGEITDAYIYDTTNDLLVGYSDTLNLNFVDIKGFMDARPDAPTHLIPASGSAWLSVDTEYTAADPSDPGITEVTVIDIAFFDALVDIGFDVTGLDSTGSSNITSAMISAVKVAADSNYIAPAEVYSLTDLMGGTSAFSNIAPTHGSDPMAMGGEQRYDAMGNSVSVVDDGFGNITEMMVDPDNANIQIKTEYLSNGDVVLTQLITDPITKVVQEVQMGSGSKVEGQYFDEVSTFTDGLEVTEREYGMSNVYSKVEINAATNVKTEFSSDARGIDTTLVVAADGAFNETIAAADGKTTIIKSVDAYGQMVISQSVLDANGQPTFNADDGSLITETVGRGMSVAQVGGGRVDTTVRTDGSKSVVNVAVNGDETLESYTATVSEGFMFALTDAGWGAAVVVAPAAAAAPTVVLPATHLEPQITTYIANGETTSAGQVTFIDIKFFDALIAANWPNLFNGSLDSTGASAITTEMIIAVGGAAAPVSVIVAAPAPALPAIGDAVTAEMVAALATAGLLAEPTYTLAGTSESKQLEDGSTQQTTTVGTQKVITTHSVQEDGSLKAVSKTEGGTTLKEEITSFDAADNPTVTAKEYLGENHTRVTVSDAETKTIVTTEAGAVTKAVVTTEAGAVKTVTTTVSADNAVVVTEQTGTAPAVTTATGTLTVLASGQYEGQETLDLITQDAAGNVTGAQEITVFAGGGERTKVFDALGNQQSNQQVYEYHDGTVWTEAIVDGVAIQTYTYTNGETETLTLDEDTGAITVTQKLLVGGSLVETAKAAGTETFADGFLTQTFDLGGGEFEVRVYENATGIEETTFKTMNGSGGFDITKVLKEVRDENGNDIVTEQTYTMVNNVATLAGTVETVISVDGTAQEKEVSATGEITLKEGGIDGLGNAYEKVLGTGTSEVVNGETINTITLADNSTVTEKYDANNNMVQKTVADQAGDSKVSTFTGGEETIAYSDALGETIDASEVDIKLDIGFANADLGFVNLDYADMASGFTSQAGDFDMSIDYSNTELATAEGGYGGASSAGSSGHGNETTNTLGYNGTNNSTNNNDGPAEDLTDFSSYFSESFNDDAPAVPDFY